MHILSNLAFGEIDSTQMQSALDLYNKQISNMKNYQKCAAPQAVINFMMNEPGKSEIDFSFDSSVKAYEICGGEKLNQLKQITTQSGTDEEIVQKILDAVSDPSSFLQDIMDFREYLQKKMQETRNLTTPAFFAWYYQQYWGNVGYTGSYGEGASATETKAFNLLRTAAQNFQNQLNALSALYKSNLSFQLSSQYQDFYLKMAPKYGPKLSLADQKRLKDFFVDTTVYNWTVEDFLSVGNMLQTVMSHEDLTNYYTSILQAVTGYFFLDKNKSADGYLARVKQFSDAAKRALIALLGPTEGASKISVAVSSSIASQAKANALDVVNQYQDLASGASALPGATMGKISPVVKAAAVGAALWLIFRK